MSARKDADTLAQQWSDVYLREATIDEDRERTNQHYALPAGFFLAVTGGDWHKYSSNLWDQGAATETESQEHELDLLADLARMRPGQQIVDVGCGWGGPLTYWTTHHAVTGVGITLSAEQQRTAVERAARHGAPAKFEVCHWREFEVIPPVDVVIADEVVVHFNDLPAYFRRAKSWLKPGGLLVTKELHFTSRRAAGASRGSLLVSSIFGDTGNYRLLHDELAMLDQAGYELVSLHQLSMENYRKTVDCWMHNLDANATTLGRIVDGEYLKRFRAYLRVIRRTMALSNMWTLDIVVARPLPD